MAHHQRRSRSPPTNLVRLEGETVPHGAVQQREGGKGVKPGSHGHRLVQRRFRPPTWISLGLLGRHHHCLSWKVAVRQKAAGTVLCGGRHRKGGGEWGGGECQSSSSVRDGSARVGAGNRLAHTLLSFHGTRHARRLSQRQAASGVAALQHATPHVTRLTTTCAAPRLVGGSVFVMSALERRGDNRR